MKKLFALISLLGWIAGMGGALNAQEALDTVVLRGRFAEQGVEQTLKFKFSATLGGKFAIDWGQGKDTIIVEDEITEFSHTFSPYWTNIDEKYNMTLSALNQASRISRFEIDSVYRYTSVSFTNCPVLKSIHITHNDLENISFSNCPALTFLDFSYNKITSLVFSAAANWYDNLTYLNCSHNDLLVLFATYCIALETLDCSYNPNLWSLSTRNCKALKSLNCSNTLMRELGLPTQSILQTLDCSNTQLTSLYLSELSDLRILDCSNNPQLENLSIQCPNLDSLHMNGNTRLLLFDIYDSRLTGIDLSDNTALTHIALRNNTMLETLDLSNLPVLEELTCANSPKLKSLDCSPQLKSLNLSGLAALQTLDCNHPQLTILQLNELPILQALDCSSTQLIALFLSELPALRTLDCSSTQLPHLSLSELPALQTLNCNNNAQLSSFYLSKLPVLQILNCSNNIQLPSLLFSELPALRTLNCSNNIQLTSLPSSEELPALQTLNCSNTKLPSWMIIEQPALRTLDCSNNPQLENLSIQCPNLDTLWMNGNTQLTSLSIYGSRLTAIDLTDNTALKNIFFQNNTLLETLDLSSLPVLKEVTCINSPKLKSVDCSNTQLTSLSLSKLPALRILNCSNTQLTSLFLSELPTLQTLNCSNNLQLTSLTIKNACLTSLDISNDTALETLSCGHNQLEKIDLSSNKNLNALYCDHNQLDKIDLSSNKNLNALYCKHNQLSFIDIPNDLIFDNISCDSNHMPLRILAALRKQAKNGIFSPQFMTATLQVGNVLNIQDEMYIDNGQTDLTLLDTNGNIIENMYDILVGHGDGLLYFKNAGQYRLQLHNQFIDQHFSATQLIVYYDLTVVDSVVRPIFSIPSGAVWPDTALILSTPTPDARIYYTTDGSEPDENALLYQGPIRITEAMTVKAVAIQDTFKSYIATASYAIDTVARPTFSIASGKVKRGTTVSLSTTTPNARIIYTTDGTEPDNNDLEYTEPIRISEAMTIKAVAIYKNIQSQVATATYTVDSVANENDLKVSKLRVYAKGRTIYLSEAIGEVEVFTVDGHCVYRGFDTAIPVGKRGLYIVSAAGRRWKVSVR